MNSPDRCPHCDSKEVHHGQMGSWKCLACGAVEGPSAECDHVWTSLTSYPPQPGPCVICGATNPKSLKSITADLDHPCRETCSGWRRGYERAISYMQTEQNMDRELIKRLRTEQDTLKFEYNLLRDLLVRALASGDLQTRQHWHLWLGDVREALTKGSKK